jgi:hypothetical protein
MGPINDLIQIPHAENAETQRGGVGRGGEDGGSRSSELELKGRVKTRVIGYRVMVIRRKLGGSVGGKLKLGVEVEERADGASV